MAITTNTEPAFEEIVRNPLALVIETDKYEINAGSPASTELDFTGTGPSDTETIEVAWGDESIEFEFAASSIDDSGLILPLKNEPMDDYCAILVSYLNRNYKFAQYFIATSAGNATDATITITAREVGTEFNITITETATNVSEGTNTAGVDSDYAENFTFLLDIWFEHTLASGTFTKLIGLEAPPNASQIATFRIEAALHAAMMADIRDNIAAALPTHGQTAQKSMVHVIKRYQLHYVERYGDPPATFLTEVSPSNYVLLAGLNYEHFPGHDFFTYFQDKWLTWQESGKEVTASQQEYLNYYNYTGSPNSRTLKLKFKLYWTDGTNSTTQVLSFTADKYRIYSFPAGYAELDLGNVDANKTVEKWEVFLTDSGDSDITERFTYYLVDAVPEWTQYFLFMNSLGAWDTLRTTGAAQKGLAEDGEEIARFLPHDYAVEDGAYANGPARYRNSYLARVGYREGREDIDYLQEFRMAPLVFEIGADNFLPITIMRTGTALYQEDDQSFAMEFEYAPAWDLTAVSKSTA